MYIYLHITHFLIPNLRFEENGVCFLYELINFYFNFRILEEKDRQLIILKNEIYFSRKRINFNYNFHISEEIKIKDAILYII